MENKLNIKEYLDKDEQKDLLRLLTAGSVDDGKSTLIGRLLYQELGCLISGHNANAVLRFGMNFKRLLLTAIVPMFSAPHCHRQVPKEEYKSHPGFPMALQISYIRSRFR